MLHVRDKKDSMTEREKSIRELATGKVTHWASMAGGDLEFLLSVIDGYREALQRCAEGAFVVEKRQELVNVARRALCGDEA